VSFFPDSSKISSVTLMVIPPLNALLPRGIVYCPSVVSKNQSVIFTLSSSASFTVRVNEEETDVEGGVILEILIFPRYGEILASESC